MHSAWLRCFGFLLLVFSCCEAAPSKGKQAQVVRVYPISEQQYEHLLKLTDGKNLISEARLTSAGFSSVRNTLGSGWHSLLRIIGFSPTETQHPKIDIDGQPLCVMKRNLDDAESGPRGIEGRAANTEESVINCIVVLKRDPALQSLSENNPDFAPYWYSEYSEEPQQKQQQQQQQEQSADIISEQVAVPEPEQQLERFIATTTTTIAPKVTKKRNKSKAKHKNRLSPASVYTKSAARQYSPYAPPPPPPPLLPQLPSASYANPYGGAYPYAGYSPDPYSQYNPYAAYSQQLAFGPQSAYGQQPYPYSPPYYGQSPYYSPSPYYEQAEDEEDIDDDEDEEYGNTVYAEPEEDDYYH